MLARIFPKLDHPLHTATAMAYTPFDLALLCLIARAVAYYARTGAMPLLTPHEEGEMV